ncbi:MAG: hypothetical protein QM813_15075 [Verrucomicrobiota bacterium]
MIKAQVYCVGQVVTLRVHDAESKAAQRVRADGGGESRDAIVADERDCAVGWRAYEIHRAVIREVAGELREITTTLGFVGLLLAVSQIGAPLLALIWGGAAWWLFGQGLTGLCVVMIVWGALVSSIDNVLKPWLIGLGIRMPMSLTILGVFGGFIAFGFLGLFIGPTLLAVAFVLLRAWQPDGRAPMTGATVAD